MIERLKIYVYILVITKGYECGRERSEALTLLLQRCALRKFQATDGQNTPDHITRGRSKLR